MYSSCRLRLDEGPRPLSVRRDPGHPESILRRRHGRDDAALLVLGTRTPAPAPALPLASEANRSSSASGSVAVFAGWGQTSGSDSMSTANTLQWARTVIKAPAYCRSNISPFDPGAQLCADDAPR